MGAAIERDGGGDPRAVLLRLFVAQRGLAAGAPRGPRQHPRGIDPDLRPARLRRHLDARHRRRGGDQSGQHLRVLQGQGRTPVGRRGPRDEPVLRVRPRDRSTPTPRAAEQLRTVLGRHLVWQSRHEPVGSAFDALFDLQGITEKIADVSPLAADRNCTSNTSARWWPKRPDDERPRSRAEAMISVCTPSPSGRRRGSTSAS